MAGRVAVIAGATRGIGFALVRALARLWLPVDTIYLTARRSQDGAAACERLAAEGLYVKWLPFDLGIADSAATLAAALQSRHEAIDIAVLNGAYAPHADLPAREEARVMIDTNNHGTLHFLRAMAPILAPHARLVIVASALGTLSGLPPALRSRFDTTVQGPDAIDAAMDDYVWAVEAGTAEREGWPAWVNVPSKIGQVAVTRSFARAYAANAHHPEGVLINAACPGVTLTDATRDFMDTVFRGVTPQTPDEAAQDLLWLITLPPGTSAPYAELVQHRRVLPYGD